MVTGASFSAQQEPPAPWAGGSCCTFTAREVFFPRRSPGKNVIGICSQRSCEFGETGGGPTLRAQSRFRATCNSWVGCGGLRGQVQRLWRCAVRRRVEVGGVFYTGLRWRVRATRRGVRCAPESLAGAVFCGALRWRVRAARRTGAVRPGVSGWFGFRRVLVRSVLCSHGSGSTLGCWRSDPRSRQLRGVYRAWRRLFGWLGCELALLRPHFNVYLTLFYGRSVVLCV